MNQLKKLLLVAAIIAAYIAIAVFATDPNTGNNVCKISKKQLFNGTQNPNGECVTTVMGEIPDINKMVSTIITFPPNGGTIQANKAFTVKTKTINLNTGFFDDPATQYYLFPQTLDNKGFIQGHSHVTIQKLDSINNPPDPKIFAFFKGLNDKAVNGNQLDVAVDKGLPPGLYRVCTMTASFGHQPTLMPVAQRGSQDDCVRFTAK